MNTNEIKETTEKELAKAYKRCFWSAVAFVVGVFIGLMLCGCKQTEYVTVPEVHEVHHHHTDLVHEVDSVIQERNTIIRELDSAAMARYGIQLKNAQRAWLVETNELRREIERLQAIRNDSTVKVDSVPYPVPVPTPVPAELSWWQQTRLLQRPQPTKSSVYTAFCTATSFAMRFACRRSRFIQKSKNLARRIVGAPLFPPKAVRWRSINLNSKKYGKDKRTQIRYGPCG